MNGIKINYNKVVELMEYVGPCYSYIIWMWIVQCKTSMHRYASSSNYLQYEENDQSKKLTMYVDGMPKATGNIAGFINSS